MLDQEKQFGPARRIKSRRLLRILVAGTLCLHLLVFVGLRQRIERGYPDFISFYAAATLVRQGHGDQIYDQGAQYHEQRKVFGQVPRGGPLPYIHPPFELLIFLPLTWLPYARAFAAWDLLNVAALFGVGLLLRGSLNRLRPIPAWEFALASLAFFPVFVCLLQGQDSILLLLLCVLAFHTLNKGEEFQAGCWLALGTFKFQWILPIVLLFIFWKKRRVAFGFLAGSVFLVLVGIGVSGWHSLMQYPAYALSVVRTPNLGGVASQSMPNLRGLLLGWQVPLSKTAGTVAVLLCSVGLFLFSAARRSPASGQPRNLNLQFSLAILVSGLIGWHTNAHDLTLLILPLVLLADYCLRAPSRKLDNKFALLYPAVPILIGPLWCILWFAVDHMNLMAIPLLWWVCAIAADLRCSGEFQISVQPQR